MPNSFLNHQIIGIVGSRRRNSSEDFEMCLKVFESIFRDGDILVSGGCPTGADRFAETIAKRNGLSILIHYADWDNHPRTGGFLRNSKIAEDCTVLIALCAEDRTGGTEDTVKKVLALKKPIHYA